MVDFALDYADVSASDALKDLIDSRQRLSNLLSSAASSSSSSSSSSLSSSSSWVPSMDDSGARVVVFEAPATLPSLTRLHHSTFERLGLPYKRQVEVVSTVRDEMLPSVLRFREADLRYPPTWPSSYPTSQRVKELICSKKLYISFFAEDGYDFTAEFDQVYAMDSGSGGSEAFSSSGSGGLAAFHDDIAAVCKRAIAALDPAMTVSPLDLDVLADYVTRVAAWEAAAGDAVAAATVGAHLPLLDAAVVPHERAVARFGHHVRVFIGTGNSSSTSSSSSSPSSSRKSELCFWVRTMPRLTFDLPRDVRLKREAAQRAAGDGAAEEEETDEVGIGKSVARLCYVRRYALDVAAARALGCAPLECMSMSPEAKAWHRQERERRGEGPEGPAGASSSARSSSSSSSSSSSGGYAVHSWYTSLLSAVGATDTSAAAAIKAGYGPLPPGPTADPGAVSLYFVFTQLPDYGPVTPAAAAAAAPPSASWPFTPAALAEGLARQGAHALRSPSACADLVGWGHSSACSLGFPDDSYVDDSAWEHIRGTSGTGDSGGSGGGDKAPQRAYAPRSVPMHPLMMMERVKMVACSPKHTLLLSFHGSLFSCGENSEGALGVGDLFSRPGFTRVSFAAGQSRVAADDEDGLFSSPGATTGGSDNSSGGGSGNPLASAPRIVKIAAGSGAVGSHSVALDSHGQVYVWGVAYAIGLGTAKPALEPKLLDTFHVDDEEREHRRLWRRAQRREQRRRAEAARRGAGAAGSDADADAGADDDVDDPADAALDAAADASIFGSVPCVDVACGGGFTLLVTRSGRVASCGVWSHGRLGLGPTPLMGKGARRRTGGDDDDAGGGGPGGTKKLARYQLRPLFVAGVRGARTVAAGEGHALCATADGALFAWGQNTCGQVGDGPDRAGYLRDHDAPCPVPPFVAADGAGTGERARAAKVFAGAYHSVVIDRAGGAWTWGARGSPCLGHGDCVSLQGAWANKVNAVFAASTAQTKAMVPFELRAWCGQWARPRRLPPLTHGDEPGQQVAQVAAGDMHTAFLTANGALYLCGSGPVVPPFFSETDVRQGKQAAQRAKAKNKSKSKSRRKRRQAKAGDEEEEEEEGNDEDESEDEDGVEDEEQSALMASAAIVTLPRKPTASWLGALSAKAVLLVAAGGTRCFALQDEELVSASVTSRLLRSLLGGGRADAEADAEEGMVLDDASLDTLAHSEASSVRGRQRREEQRRPFYFEQRGRADCMLIASGKILLAHKAVLSLRSPALRDMIAMETEAAVDADGFDMDDDALLAAGASGDLPGAQSVVKVLLPELHSDVAKALLCFLYTDVLPHACIGNSFVLRSLQRAGHSLRVPRLQIVAQNLLEALSFVELELLVSQGGDGKAAASSSSGSGGTRDFVENVGANAATEMPPSTLARDMGQLLGEPLFADVRFLAEGRAVLAHKFLLESRSPYFRALFRSGGMMHQPRATVVQRGRGRRRERASVVDIVVPDTFVGFLRLLLFVYTDTLPDGSDDALLEDLLAADRYGLQDMKDLCESMLAPSRANWFNVLRAAELVNSDKLRALTASFLQDNFAVLLGSVAVEVEVEVEAEGLGDGGAGAGGGGGPPMQPAQVSFIAFLRQEFPELLDSVLARRARSFPLPPPQLLLRHMKEGSLRKKLLGTPGEQFPWWALGVMFVVAALYPYAAQVIALGPVVPVINVIFTLVVVLWTFGCFGSR